MKITYGRILSLLIAIGYLVFFFGRVGARDFVIACFVVLFPVALIWFADSFSELRTYSFSSYNIDEGTPAIFISAMGWFFLVGLPVLLYFLIK